MSATVHVEGLKELDRAFGRMSKDLRKELRAELRDVGRIVSTEAQQIARAKGLERSGLLIRRIRPTVKGGSVFIRAGAKAADGFNYPRRYEFQAGGRQAFMKPALERKTEAVVDGIDKVLGRLAGENGFD